MTKTTIVALLATIFFAPPVPASAHELFGGSTPHYHCNGRVQFNSRCESGASNGSGSGSGADSALPIVAGLVVVGGLVIWSGLATQSERGGLSDLGVSQESVWGAWTWRY